MRRITVLLICLLAVTTAPLATPVDAGAPCNPNIRTC